MILGIVGPEASKWTKKGEELARIWIRTLLTREDITGVTSGHCPKGGVDIWVEEELPSIRLIQDVEDFIFPAKVNNWSGGYRPRNIQIAKKADEMHVIVPALPAGRSFPTPCYHCKTDSHGINGGCWTARYAEKMGKKAFWHIIEQE